MFILYTLSIYFIIKQRMPMLKKLVKYGNSWSLVIDKAILELLEIDESGVVKLQTDGKSLMITPVKESQKKAAISYEVDEAAALASFANYEKFKKQYSNTDQNKKQLVLKEAEAINAKYDQDVKQFLQIKLTPEFQNAISKISEIYDPSTQAEEYGAAFNEIKYQFCPNLKKMDLEIAALEKQHLVKK